jgi:hypothetical protein
MEHKANDLFNNPMVSSARNAMTPEQIEEYKKVGEYMYNNHDFVVATAGSKVKDTNETDLVLYASEALKAGLDPYDLSEPELQALNNVYGNEWYIRFELDKSQVPKLASQIVSAKDVLNQSKHISRQASRQASRTAVKQSSKKNSQP